MNKPILYLMLGYPGAGKTTAAKAIHQLTGAVHLWADKIRNERYSHPTHSHQENLELYSYLNELAAELLATGQSVVFDTGFNFYKDREHLRRIAEKHDADTRLVWVQTKVDLARQRATHESHAQRNTYPQVMPAEQFNRISGDFEPPERGEKYVAMDGINITPETVKQALQEYNQ